MVFHSSRPRTFRRAVRVLVMSDLGLRPLPPPSQQVFRRHLRHGAHSCASFWSHPCWALLPHLGWVCGSNLLFIASLMFVRRWSRLLLIVVSLCFAWLVVVVWIAVSIAWCGIAIVVRSFIDLSLHRYWGHLRLSRRWFSTFCERDGCGQCL